MLIRKNIAITERMNEMAEEIKQKKAVKSFTGVVELAINELHSRTFKDYVIAQQGRNQKAAMTPEERAAAEIEKERLKEQQKEQELLDIAAELNGEIITLGGGEKRVKYYTYDRNNRYEQEVPLTMMSEDLVENQYFPSKEEILKRQKEGKVKYDPNN